MESEIHLGCEAQIIYGLQDRNLRKLRSVLNVDVSARDETLFISGTNAAVKRANIAIEQIRGIAASKHALESHEVDSILGSVANDVKNADRNSLEVFRNGRMIMPRTEGQQKYMAAIKKNSIVFCIGPAGTGKTYLAVAAGVSALKKKQIRRIILARPAVEAGEKLGYLPGDLREKVNPYLRPLYDAMDDMMDFDEVRKSLSKGIVEIVPLAFMRGRTLNDAFVILDEGQNSTTKQMKMFLTRLGENTRAVVTGDITQVDLPDSEEPGLRHAWDVLGGIKGIGYVKLSKKDIVRHRLVQDIVEAYEKVE